MAADDGTGTQRFSIVPVNGQAGQYYILAANRGTCANVLGVQACTSANNLFGYVAGDDGACC